MTKKFAIPFLLCLFALILSEYFLLVEFYSDRRFPFLVSYSVILMLSIGLFLLLYKKYHKISK